MFLVCSSSIFDIVMINDGFAHLFVEPLVHYSSMLGDKDYIESFVVHSLGIRQVEHDYKDCLALFLIFLINLHDG